MNTENFCGENMSDHPEQLKALRPSFNHEFIVAFTPVSLTPHFDGMFKCIAARTVRIIASSFNLNHEFSEPFTTGPLNKDFSPIYQLSV